MGLEELKKKKLRLEVDYLKVEWELISTEWRQNLITFEQDSTVIGIDVFH